jgi:fumarylacetoacetase
MSSVLKSWIDIPEGSDWTIYNLPFGVFRLDDGAKHIGTAIGEFVCTRGMSLSEI